MAVERIGSELGGQCLFGFRLPVPVKSILESMV